MPARVSVVLDKATTRRSRGRAGARTRGIFGSRQKQLGQAYVFDLLRFIPDSTRQKREFSRDCLWVYV